MHAIKRARSIFLKYSDKVSREVKTAYFTIYIVHTCPIITYDNTINPCNFDYRYDPQTESIIFANNHPFTKENYKQAGLRSEALFRFCRRMIKMKVDNAEFGLLTAITIFSERKNLKARKRVEKIQEIYVDALRSYVMSHRKKDPTVAFAKLLGALVELRSLGNLNSRTCFDLKLVNRRLPDFLAEIWDIK